jgi:hypothetical protein
MKSAGRILLILVVGMPATFLLTMMSWPFWRWFENTTGIEAFSESGPAHWCYGVVYAIGVVGTVLYALRRKPDQCKGQ